MIDKSNAAHLFGLTKKSGRKYVYFDLSSKDGKFDDHKKQKTW